MKPMLRKLPETVVLVRLKDIAVYIRNCYRERTARNLPLGYAILVPFFLIPGFGFAQAGGKFGLSQFLLGYGIGFAVQFILPFLLFGDSESRDEINYGYIHQKEQKYLKPILGKPFHDMRIIAYPEFISKLPVDNAKPA